MEKNQSVVIAETQENSIGIANSTPNSTQEVSLYIPCYMDYALQEGDSDQAKKWGNATKEDAGTWVKDLQSDLMAFGIFSGQADGVFGKGTKKFLKLFQWVATNSRRRLVDKSVIDVEKTFAGQITGTMDTETCAEIKLWKSNNYYATGNLCATPISRYPNFKRGTLSSVRNDIETTHMVVDRDFLIGLDQLNTAAKSNSITVSVNQTFRVQGAAVGGAVVTPANRSQHLIGHGIDINMIDGSNTLVTANFKNNTATQNAKNFIRDAKAGGLRWGGDFDVPEGENFDPPHFDLQVHPDKFDYDAKFFLNQQQLSKNQPIPEIAS